MTSTGPLVGVKVVEIGAIGPVTHAMMMLADLGADVVRVARPPGTASPFADVQDTTLRGRRQLTADLKTREGRELVLDLVAHADVLVEGFRPGVCERLGIGPAECTARNSRLIYARMTGWGQSGPLSQRAGHDINYISLTGALHAIGPACNPPVTPLNLVGDFGGGSMFLVTGILAALHERQSTGSGRVLDVAMVDGVAVLEQSILSMRETGMWNDGRGSNLIDGGAPFYDTYVCKDGRWVAVGALEAEFYANLLAGLGLDSTVVPAQSQVQRWPELRRVLAEMFLSKPRDEWARVFADIDACVTPVLDFEEAARHPHLMARKTFVPGAAMTQASPAPRFSGRGPLPVPGRVREIDPPDVLAEWAEGSLAVTMKAPMTSDETVLAKLLEHRRSCRAYIPDQVPREVIERILGAAKLTPSWCNTQPWHVHITEGEATDRFRRALSAHVQTHPVQEPDLPFPDAYEGVHRERRRTSGWQLYDSLGIAKGDRVASGRQMLRNYELFDAPHVAIITTEADLGVYGAVDCGLFVQSFLLAAESLAVAAVPQAAIAGYAPFVREYFALPPERFVLLGISFGYPDETHPANGYRTDRQTGHELVTWVDR
jgi:alpha-methylacyl-CoA racemase